MSHTIPIEPDRIYHVYNRGVNSGKIFTEKRHYFKFMNRLFKYIPSIGTIYAWCLIENHYHLLIRTKTMKQIQGSGLIKGDFSEKGIINFNHQQFSNFANSYTKYFNPQTNRTGSLFDSRFKKILVDTEKYFQNVLTYIHTNPVHHGICKSPLDYSWSSYNYYLDERKRLPFMEEIISEFGGIETFRARHEGIRSQLDPENDFV